MLHTTVTHSIVCVLEVTHFFVVSTEIQDVLSFKASAQSAVLGLGARSVQDFPMPPAYSTVVGAFGAGAMRSVFVL